MKSQILCAVAKLVFFVAAIDFAWMILAILTSLGSHSAATPLGLGDTIIEEHGFGQIIVLLLPYVLLLLLVGFGFYLRWLGKRFEMR